jgi:hypothetical protein
MSSRQRAAVFAALVVACTAAVVVIAIGLGDGSASGTSGAARTLLPEAKAGHRAVILFRQAGGQLAVAPLGDVPGRAQPVGLRCDRVTFGTNAGLCVARGGGFAAGYRAQILGPDLRVRAAVGVEGVPSRARVSRDGRYGTVTMFVTGHSYALAGSFSTQTTLIDLARGATIADLEDFTVTRDGRQVTAIDVNYWGVTFDPSDSDRFWATLATGGHTYLIEGSISARTAHTIHENVECPSISPDGTRIAYKKRTGSASAPWHLAVLELATQRETLLSESRSVDDQVEWLDDHHVLYGVAGAIWTAPADGSGRPSQYVARAASPAVVRW